MNISQFQIPLPARNFANSIGNLYAYDQLDSSALMPAFYWIANQLNLRSPSREFFGNELFDDGTMARPDRRMLRFLEYYIQQQRENAKVDYSDPLTFLCFDILYFYRNLLKCLYAAHHLQNFQANFRRVDRVIDLGCGVGTFTAACKMMNVFSASKYLLVDESFFQLAIAEKFITRLQMADGCDYDKRDAFLEFDRRGVMIASYWLCGNKNRVLSRSDQDLKRVIKDGLVLVDYRPNVYAFIQRIDAFCDERTYFELRAPVPTDAAPLIGGRDISVHMLVIPPH